MAQIVNKGQSVILYERTKTGKDEFNRDVYEEKPVIVENVFIGRPEANEVVSEMNLSGRRIVYTLGIPRGDTHDWENVTVEFYGRKWKTFGIPVQGNTKLMPFVWDKNVTVEAYE